LGVDLGGGLGFSQPATIEIESTLDRPKSTWLRITIAEGKNRQVRRMLHAIGHGCMELERVRIGGIILGKIVPNPGDFCEISGEEILEGLGFQPRVIVGGVAGKIDHRAPSSRRRERKIR
jgi:16S rRNA U516 pseudouridylate synthase RsuA-like enzyme